MRFSTELIFAVIAAAGINILHVESTTVKVNVATFNSSSKLNSYCGIDVPADTAKHTLFLQLENVATEKELTKSEKDTFCQLAHGISDATTVSDGRFTSLIDDFSQRTNSRVSFQQAVPNTFDACGYPGGKTIDIDTLEQFENIFKSKDFFGNKKHRSLNRAQKHDFCKLIRKLSTNPTQKDEIIGKLALLKKRVDSVVSFDGIKSWAKYITRDTSSRNDD
jgi:hypothetical protein